MDILAISGSLRKESINSAFCRAAARLAPEPLRVSAYAGLAALPLFNPDLEASPPGAVRDFRTAVGSARALVIASPEYAHGISGVMKNGLDWLVSFEGFVDKPVVLINASPRARHAHEALREVLQTMSAKVVLEASVTLPLIGACVTEDAMVSSSEVGPKIRAALTSLGRALASHCEPGPSFPLG